MQSAWGCACAPSSKLQEFLFLLFYFFNEVRASKHSRPAEHGQQYCWAVSSCSENPVHQNLSKVQWFPFLLPVFKDELQVVVSSTREGNARLHVPTSS